MTLTLAEFDALREGWDIEVKKAAGRDGRGKLPADFWPTYSAMANTRGGRVMLGVTERSDHSFQVHGVGDPERVEIELWILLQNPEKISANLLSRGDVRVEEIAGTGGRRILVIDIPQAPRHLRPVHEGRDPFTGTWYRVHEGDRRADRERVRRMIADADPEGSDSRVQEHYTLDDLDPASIRRLRSLLSDRRSGHPFLHDEGVDFLRRIRAWGLDRETGAEGPTLAGLLLLGHENAIRDRLDAFHLDYRELAEPDAARWVDRVWPDGTWNANLLGFYLRVLEKLHDRLPVPFRLSPDLFRRDETPVHEALREALVNALIHADYTTGNGIRVFREPGRFRFINPGTLLLSLDQIRQGGESACRNRTLQHLFALIGAGERAGSGFPAILSAWREQHWRLPTLREDVEKEETSLLLSMESLLPQGTLETLRDRFPGRFGELDEAGRSVLALALLEGPVDHARLSEAVGLHSRDLTLLLQTLQRRGLLERLGRGKGCAYQLPAPRSERHDTRSEHNEDSSEHSGIGSEHNDSDSEHSGSDSEHKDEPRTPAEDLASIPEVALIAGSRRVSTEKMEHAILALCQGRFLTLPQIVDFIQRSPSTIRTHYLRPLIEQGRVELRFPHAPNHPQQAYRTVQAFSGDEP
ncbi:MAG: RNA-binding domain-containing protein [Pseudomonadota bacterium]